MSNIYFIKITILHFYSNNKYFLKNVFSIAFKKIDLGKLYKFKLMWTFFCKLKSEEK